MAVSPPAVALCSRKREHLSRGEHQLLGEGTQRNGLVVTVCLPAYLAAPAGLATVHSVRRP